MCGRIPTAVVDLLPSAAIGAFTPAEEAKVYVRET